MLLEEKEKMRDHLASLAMQAILTGESMRAGNQPLYKIAIDAYDMADEMMRQRGFRIEDDEWKQTR